MAIVKWNSAIEYVKGALSKPKKQDGHSHGDYLIGTHREAPTQNPNCTRAYVKQADAYDRSTPPSENEMAARTRFAAVSAAILVRKQNLTTYTTDKANCEAQKNTPGGRKTCKSYMWKVCGEIYDASLEG